MFITRLSQLLNVKYPVIQGGMAWVATHELASAVSEAGGLGIIAAGNASGDFVRDEIRKLKKLTDKPFGVNIMLMSRYVEDIVDIVCEEGVPVVTTGAGNPGKYIKRFKENNITVIPVVPSVALAVRLGRLGVDALIVEGTEAGGHVGELTTMTLIPQVADAVSIPIIAAGGIGDNRGLTAAIALGADGVQVGTRFVCSTEAKVHPKYKDQIVKSKDRDAIVLGRSTGHPVRVLKNKFTREFLDAEKANVDASSLDKMGLGRLKSAVVDGDVDQGSVMGGQISGLICDIKPCKDIIEDLFDNDKILERLRSMKAGESYE